MNKKIQEMTRHEEIKKQHDSAVTADSLKAVLWETLGDLRRSRIDSNKAQAVSKVSSAILQTVKLETEVSKMLGGASEGLTKFAFDKSVKVISSVTSAGEAKAYKKLQASEEPKGH